MAMLNLYDWKTNFSAVPVVKVHKCISVEICWLPITCNCIEHIVLLMVGDEGRKPSSSHIGLQLTCGNIMKLNMSLYVYFETDNLCMLLKKNSSILNF